MAVTLFKFPPLFRKPKNVEIPKRLGVRAVVAYSSNNFLLTLQDILNPVLSLTFGKMQVIKKYSRFSRFLLWWQDYNCQIESKNSANFMQELLLKRNHLFFPHFSANNCESQRMHMIIFCGSQAQILAPKKRDSLRNFHRTYGLPLENYLPDRTNHYRKCPTVRGPLGNTDLNISATQNL